MATSAKLPVTRQLGYVALIAADGGVDKAWALGRQVGARLRDLVDAMPLIRDPGQRASLYPKVLPLLRAACRRSWPRRTTARPSWAATSASSCPATRRR